MKIVLKNLSKAYNTEFEEVQAVNNVDLSVEPGEFISVTGRSGSGKTTLLNLIGTLTRPSSGLVFLDGVSIWGLTDARLSLFRSSKIGFIFQFPSLLPSLTILENVLLPILFIPAAPGSLEREYRERASELLELCGLGDKIHAYPCQLSGGQQKRTAIARALINRPQLLLADEPTADLDEETESEVMELLGKINRGQGTTLVLVTHNMDFDARANRIFKMSNGAISEI